MLSRILVLPLGLWVATADAFFGYCPAWHAGCEGQSVGDVFADVKVEGRRSPAAALPSIPGVMTCELHQRPELV